MARESKPLVFQFRGKPEDSGANRFPGCVTFQIYMHGSARQAIMDWLNETCPDGHVFGQARVWRGLPGRKGYRCEVPVVHIMDRGVAAMFKMVFAKTQQEQRQYERAQRAKRRKAA